MSREAASRVWREFWVGWYEGDHEEGHDWVDGPGAPVTKPLRRLHHWLWAKENKVRLWWHVKHSRKYLITRLDQADREIIRARRDADNWVVNLQLKCEAAGAIPTPGPVVTNEEYVRVMNGGKKAQEANEAALRQDMERAGAKVNPQRLGGRPFPIAPLPQPSPGDES